MRSNGPTILQVVPASRRRTPTSRNGSAKLNPSNELRHFFGHESARWQEFRRRYLAELKRPDARAFLAELEGFARNGKLTLAYSARGEEHNQAVVLKELLKSQSSNG